MHTNNYNTYSESDLESETNFQQPAAKMSNNSNFVQNNSVKKSNKPAQRNTLTTENIQRRASECSYYGVSDNGADNISYYGMPVGGQKRGSFSGNNGRRRSRSNKSSISSSSGDVSSGSGSSTCSGDDTTSTSSGQPNLPYPGFVEYSFKYLSQDARPRNWCLKLITNPYPFQKKKMTHFIFIYLNRN